MPRAAKRTDQIMPFHVVELFKQAAALNAQGRDVISLGIGEPDFTAPPQVVETMRRAAQAGLSGYTAPAGLPTLREAIAHYYTEHFSAPVESSRVVVTSGASGALLLATMTLIDPGDEVLMPDPSYPANRNFITSAGGIVRLVTCHAEHNFQMTAADVRANWTPATRGVLIASPSNPTGTTIARDELAALIAEVRQHDGFVIMDEIYLGLYYGGKPESALTIDDDVIIINSFSKYFHMTGWRLGWMIVPKPLVPVIEKLAASLAICAPTLAQHAALTCFEPEVMRIYENRRQSFQKRRDYLLAEFDQLGLNVPAKPDGAFYIYADISNFSHDSDNFSHRLLHEASIAAVPGRDFGPAHASHTMRFSYATGLDRLHEAVERMQRFLA